MTAGDRRRLDPDGAGGSAGERGQRRPGSKAAASRARLQRLSLARRVPPGLNPNELAALQASSGNAAVSQFVRVQRQDPPTPSAAGLLVEDSAPAEPDQLAKSVFLAELRTAVTAAANDTLAPYGRTAADCPFIERAFARYASQRADQIEGTLRRYAPEAANAATARAYLPAVTAQVRSGVRRWAAAGGPSAGGPAPADPTETLTAIGGLAGGLIAAAGRLLLRVRPGGRRDADPAAIKAGLGAGRPLEAGARDRMEGAFGADFGAVRVHDDQPAATAATQLNARAFTIGNDIGFAADDFRPGTPGGDALLAHELAHVLQQGDGPARAAERSAAERSAGAGPEPGEDPALERAADVSAGRALVSLWGGGSEALQEIGDRVGPTLRTGLRVQRCGGGLSGSDEKTWLDKVKAQSSSDLDTQAVSAADELRVLEATANQIRAKAAAKALISADVLTPWDEAFRAMVAMQPGLLKNKTLDPDLKAKATAALEVFYANFRKTVADKDYIQYTKSRSGVNLRKNPYLTEEKLKGERYPAFTADTEGILKRLRKASSVADWSEVVADFHSVAHAMDRYIADRLRMEAKKEEAKTLAGHEQKAGDAIANLEAALAKGEPDPVTANAAKVAMENFAVALRGIVAHADYMKKIEPKAVKSTPPYMARVSDFLSAEDLAAFQAELGRAHSAGQFRAVIERYKRMREARDRYLADEKIAGSSEEADRLVQSGGVSRGIDQLRQEHPDAQKVRTIFYPEPSETQLKDPGYKPVAIPIELFLFRQGDEWKLRDLTTPLEPKENEADAAPGKPPPLGELFDQLDSKLRFPRGLLTYKAADGTSGEQRTHAERELSDWLSLIGLTLAAVGLAVATAGASTAATALIISASVAGIGAAAAAMAERSEQGMLTTMDIVVGVSTIASEVFTALTAGMGKLIVSGAGKTGTFAKMAVLADRYYIPTTKIMMGTNVVSFITVSVKGAEDLRKIQESGASQDEQDLAGERLTQQMLLLGGITMLGLKGDIASFKSGRNLYFDPDFAEGGMARAMLKNDELLTGARRLSPTTELDALLARKDLPESLAHRMNAELSDALAHGRIPDPDLKRVLDKMPANATTAQLEAVLADLRRANRLVHAGVLGEGGKVLIDDVGGKLRVRVLLTDAELAKRGKALGTDTNVEVALARTDFDETFKAQVRRELSTAMATGQIDQEGFRKVIGSLKKAKDQRQATESLAELIHGNRIAESGLAKDTKVILGATQGVEYDLAGRKITIDPVADADSLYAGTDGAVHLDEVKNTVNALRQKLSEKPQQLQNMKAWLAADPSNRRIGVIIETEAGWTDLMRPNKGNPMAALKQLSTAQIPLRIAGRDLSASQLDALWDAIEAKAKSLKQYPPGPDFFAKMPTLADAETFLGIKL